MERGASQIELTELTSSNNLFQTLTYMDDGEGAIVRLVGQVLILVFMKFSWIRAV